MLKRISIWGTDIVRSAQQVLHTIQSGRIMNLVLTFTKCLGTSRFVGLLSMAGLLIVATQAVVAQKPKLKLLEYKAPGDSLIICRPGPYFVEDTVQLRPGVLVDNREVYCTDCWRLRIGELSVDASRFLEHIGDTVTAETCEFLPDSSKAVFQRIVEDLGPCKLRRSNASKHITAPCLIYDIIFDNPTKLGVVWDYVEALEVDNNLIIGRIK